MDNYYFNQWCKRAVSGIIFPPDSAAVSEELFDHMMDHYEDLIAQGCDEITARDRTIEAMGDPYIVARQLAAIHRPFWGYFLRATRIILVVLLAVTIVTFLNFMHITKYSQPGFSRYDPYCDTYLSDENGVVNRILYEEPGQQIKSDGYTLKMARASWMHTESAGEEPVSGDFFHFQIEITNPLPWAEEPNILQWIWAQDSEGNFYAPYCSSITENYLLGRTYHSAPFTWTLDFCTHKFVSQNADWFDVYYCRDGRQIRFRIDLPGGETQ